MFWRHIKQTIAAVAMLALLAGGAGLAIVQATRSKMMSVQSGSMAPHILKGDLVTVKSVPDYQVGDVITYTNPAEKSQTITHRIIYKEQDSMNTTYLTQGDANPLPDAPIHGTDIVGKVQHTVPLLGYAIDFVRKPLGLIAVIYIPALLVVLHEIRRLGAYYKTQHYMTPEFMQRLRRKGRHGRAATASVFTAFVLVGGIAAPTLAQLSSTATLTGNTISTAPLEEPEEPPTNTCNNNVNISNNTNQSATSGDAAVEGNTQGGSATSGNASNSSNTNVSVTITC